jgi:hypothetical protein
VLGNLNSNTCNRFGDDWWTDDPATAGDYAWATQASFAWTESSSTGCHEQLRLYCFQQ